jgi:hypothetical protein
MKGLRWQLELAGGPSGLSQQSYPQEYKGAKHTHKPFPLPFPFPAPLSFPPPASPSAYRKALAASARRLDLSRREPSKLWAAPWLSSKSSIPPSAPGWRSPISASWPSRNLRVRPSSASPAEGPGKPCLLSLVQAIAALRQEVTCAGQAAPFEDRVGASDLPCQSRPPDTLRSTPAACCCFPAGPFPPGPPRPPEA